ncbi:MAG: hypothetical protein ACN6O8_18295 [Achromobacter sp.]|uniref:hypothetical protein n=1 Tax=Achromobacter sp. TaxID=134375 RepID=UPI003CFFAEF1
MEHTGWRLEGDFLRFLPEVYEAAQQKKLDGLPLLTCVEDARNIATGVGAVLTIIQNNEIDRHQDDALSDFIVDQMMGLCRTALSLLNDKIEHTADYLCDQTRKQRKEKVEE